MTQLGLGLARIGWKHERPAAVKDAWAEAQETQRRRREALLLSYVPMSFNVAFSLTKNKIRARDLARDVLTWAWNAEESVVFGPTFKMDLLRQLRQRSACLSQ